MGEFSYQEELRYSSWFQRSQTKQTTCSWWRGWGRWRNFQSNWYHKLFRHRPKWVRKAKQSRLLKFHTIWYVLMQNIPNLQMLIICLWTWVQMQWQFQRWSQTRKVSWCKHYQQSHVSRYRFRWIHKRKLQRSRRWQHGTLQFFPLMPCRLPRLTWRILSLRSFPFKWCTSYWASKGLFWVWS